MPPKRQSWQLLSCDGGWSILGHLLAGGGFRATFGGMPPWKTEEGVVGGRGRAGPGGPLPEHSALLFSAGRGLLGGFGFTWWEERRDLSPSPGHQGGTQGGAEEEGLPPSHQLPGLSHRCAPHVWGWSGQGRLGGTPESSPRPQEGQATLL